MQVNLIFLLICSVFGQFFSKIPAVVQKHISSKVNGGWNRLISKDIRISMQESLAHEYHNAIDNYVGSIDHVPESIHKKLISDPSFNEQIVKFGMRRFYQINQDNMPKQAERFFGKDYQPPMPEDYERLDATVRHILSTK